MPGVAGRTAQLVARGRKKLYVLSRRRYRTARHALRMLITDGPLVAHHGMQRSGTNYLCSILVEAGARVVNEVDPVRSSARHKHCRWQDDKLTISMDPAYRNEFHVESVADLNRVAGYQANTRHVLIFKQPDLWLASIRRWALRSGWLSTDDSELRWTQAAREWLVEWDAYHTKWFSLADQAPDEVLIVNWQRLVAHRSEAPPAIAGFLGGGARLATASTERTVAHSPGGYTPPSDEAIPSSWRDLVSEVVTCDWQRRLSLPVEDRAPREDTRG